MANFTAAEDEAAWGRFKIDQQRRNLSSITIRNRRVHLTRLAEYLAPKSVLHADLEDIERWVTDLAVGPRTQSIYLSSAHAFFAWARHAGVVEKDPTEHVARPRTSRLVPRPISADDLNVAIDLAPPRMKAWLTLAAYQGFRCKEIATLRGEDVLVRHVPPLLMVTAGKGGHQGVLPLNPIAERSLRQHGLPERGWVFPARSGNHVSANVVSQLGNRYLHSLGITSTMHALRHFFGTAVWSATKDIRVTQEMLRHADPRTSTIYVAFDQEIAVRAVRGLGGEA